MLYAQLPYPIAADHGQDVRDWLNEGHKLADLPTVPANPVIIVGTDESRVIDEAEAALATREIFQRAGYMVQVVVGAAPPAGFAPPRATRPESRLSGRRGYGNCWQTRRIGTQQRTTRAKQFIRRIGLSKVLKRTAVGKFDPLRPLQNHRSCEPMEPCCKPPAMTMPPRFYTAR